jgi:hypothetical protein
VSLSGLLGLRSGWVQDQYMGRNEGRGDTLRQAQGRPLALPGPLLRNASLLGMRMREYAILCIIEKLRGVNAAAGLLLLTVSGGSEE